MRFARAAVLLAFSASPAFAQKGPVIVVPGKPGVPVYINGVEASWATVEGEFGLDRPGQVTPTIVYQPLVLLEPPRRPAPFFPKSGKRPGYGRLEVIPPANRPLPPPAPTYYRNWSTQSDMSAPVTTYAPYYGPEMIAPPYWPSGSSSGSSGGAAPTVTPSPGPSASPAPAPGRR
jgi:hypothetical protein